MQTTQLMHRVVAYFLTLFLFGFCAGASATILTFTGFDNGVPAGGARPNSDAASAAFLASIGAASSSVIDFEAFAIGPYPVNLGGGISMSVSSGFNGFCMGICGTDDTVLGYNTTAGGSKHVRLVPVAPGDCLGDGCGGGDVDVEFSFAAPINSFGLFIAGSQITQQGQLSILFNDGSLQQLPVGKNDSSGGVEFFGFFDIGAALTSVTFRVHGPFFNDSRDIVGIDDIRIANVQVPEPATLGLLVIALVGLAAQRRRKPS